MQVQAAVLDAPKAPLRIETLELEAPRDREIRVRVVAKVVKLAMTA